MFTARQDMVLADRKTGPLTCSYGKAFDKIFSSAPQYSLKQITCVPTVNLSIHLKTSKGSIDGINQTYVTSFEVHPIDMVHLSCSFEIHPIDMIHLSFSLHSSNHPRSP